LANLSHDSSPRYWLPKSAYIHVPFCRHRCGYCNFTLVAGRDDLVEQYLVALTRELSWLESPRLVETLYFGGGTPSHLPPDSLRRLMDSVTCWLPREQNSEFTAEANPLDIDAARLNVLRDAGVTRLSLGVQSFHEWKLKLLERDHRQRDIERAYELVRRCLPSISIDLIFGTPGESLSHWETDLQAAIKLQPDHISVYGLTWERGTRFWSRLQKGELSSCAEELERAMYVLAIDSLVAAGYEHYEVSNFARPRHRCRHNEVYWTGRTYYGAGPGAARHVGGRRETNHRSTTTYLHRVLTGLSPVAESETLSDEEAARERLVFGLRRLEGLEAPTFESETGFDLRALGGKALERFVEAEYLQWSNARLHLTREGLLVSDSLWGELLT
jgi:oxygen-independent coproporphyrinogen-3 oxidase